MHEWNSVVVSSFGWWSHHVGAPDSNGMCLIQTFTLQTTIVGLPSSDIGVLHSFTYINASSHFDAPSAIFQWTYKTGWTEISLHTRKGPWLLRTSSPLRAWQSIQPPTSTRAHLQSFRNTPPLRRISACPPGPVVMSGQRASAVLLDVPWVNWFSIAKLTPDLLGQI